MSHKEPWELFPNIWKTKSEFFIYVRGGVRKSLWSRYPAKIQWKKSQCVKPPASYTGKAKTLGQCVYCKDYFPASQIEVDHIERAGSCRTWEEMQVWIYNLLQCNDNWCLACKICHKIKSYAETHDLTMEEAKIQKDIIKLLQDEKVSDIIMFIEMWNFDEMYLTNNAKNRRQSLSEIFNNVQ